jgi:Ca2+-binding EF-hand superfamily protein
MRQKHGSVHPHQNPETEESKHDTQTATNLLITDLFRLIAEQEYEIEEMRQEITMHPQMVAHKAFQELDKEGKGFVTKDDLIGFLKKYYIRISEGEAEEVIREFDATEDGTLNVEEFQ